MFYVSSPPPPPAPRPTYGNLRPKVENGTALTTLSDSATAEYELQISFCDLDILPDKLYPQVGAVRPLYSTSVEHRARPAAMIAWLHDPAGSYHEQRCRGHLAFHICMPRYTVPRVSSVSLSLQVVALFFSEATFTNQPALFVLFVCVCFPTPSCARPPLF